MLIKEYPIPVNNNGTIILLDNGIEAGSFLHKGLKELGHKNQLLLFDDAESAGEYLRQNIANVFMLLQSNTTPGVQIPNTRNMVYMHEKIDTDKIPYIFLVLSENILPQNGLHTFVHCYYKPVAVHELITTLNNVIDFWKDHVFPPRITHKL